MKLGMNMLLWSTDVCDAQFDPVFEMLKDAGYDGVEIPIFDREVEKYADLPGAARPNRARGARAFRPVAATTTRSRPKPPCALRRWRQQRQISTPPLRSAHQ